jgi:hypothetical protein
VTPVTYIELDSDNVQGAIKNGGVMSGSVAVCVYIVTDLINWMIGLMLVNNAYRNSLFIATSINGHFLMSL